MSKCSECLNKKGQRKCRKNSAVVCSLCCGQIRNAHECLGCSFFKDTGPKRNYNDIPRFSTSEMDRDFELQSASNVIEGALCAWDDSFNNTLKDDSAIRVLELLLDKYHFHDEKVTSSDETILLGFDGVASDIEAALNDISPEVLCKILSILRFVARRRTQGRREYFSVIRQYVGSSITPDMRILPSF